MVPAVPSAFAICAFWGMAPLRADLGTHVSIWRSGPKIGPIVHIPVALHALRGFPEAPDLDPSRRLKIERQRDFSIMDLLFCSV